MLETTVAGIRLEHPIMNAAGPRCKYMDEIEELSRAPTAAVMLGSITWDGRLGNRGETYYSDWKGLSINSLGLPNPGREFYERDLRSMAEVASRAGKTLWVSVAGFTPDEYARLTILAMRHGASLVELNLGCPNAWQGGTQKEIAALNPVLTAEILEKVKQAVESEIKPEEEVPIAAKVSPYLLDFVPSHPNVEFSRSSANLSLLERIGVVIANSNIVSVVTTCNTIPNARVLVAGNSVIKSPDIPNGFGGLAGPILKEASIEQVWEFRKLLPSTIDVIGAGGIRTGKDVADYLKAGASAVQVATAYADEGASVFGRILGEFVGLQTT